MKPSEANESQPRSRVAEFKTMIRESHLDTFGHVNNAKYLEILEEARWDIITPHGFGVDDIRRKQMGPVILEIHLQFRRELRNREHITVRSWCKSHSGKITVLRQVILNEKGEEACSADFVFGLFDLNARKLIEPTPEWLRALGIN